MSSSRLRKHLRNVFFNILSDLQSNLLFFKNKLSKSIEHLKLVRIKPQIFAYQLLEGKVSRLFPLFYDLKSNLKKSGMKTNFKAYVSTAILASFLLSSLVLVFVISFLCLIFDLSLFLSILFGLGLSLLAGALTIIGFYLYPSYCADNLRRSLEDDLTFTAGYMSILAGAGVPPDFIWRSLAQINSSHAISKVAKNVVRDVELFGFDVISALETTSKRAPSEKFKELVEGFISVVHSGGNLVKYLRNRSQQYMKFKQINLKRFSDNLSVLSEFYVTLMVAGSLIFVVMLAVMSMLGGGGVGSLDSRLLLQLLTYLGLPIGSIIFLIIIDITSPKR